MDCSFIGVASKQSSQRALWGREPRVGGEKEEVHLHSLPPDNELIQLSGGGRGAGGPTAKRRHTIKQSEGGFKGPLLSVRQNKYVNDFFQGRDVKFDWSFEGNVWWTAWFEHNAIIQSL